MSHFGSLMKDFDEDFFGKQISALDTQIRSMDRLMNSMVFDSFNAMRNCDTIFQQNTEIERQGGGRERGIREARRGAHNAIGFGATPNMNSIFSANIGNNGTSYYSSAIMTMSSGPDGKPQIYQASTSTKSGPGGIRETWRSLQDSLNGVKKMAVGHHIGERAHIIEKEQNLRSGQLEERQEFINLLEEQAEEFDREFTTKARRAIAPIRITGGKKNANDNAALISPSSTDGGSIKQVDDDDNKNDIEDNINQKINACHMQRQPSLSSSSNSARRQSSQVLKSSVQPNQSQNSIRSQISSLSSVKRNQNRLNEVFKAQHSMSKKEISTKKNK